MSDVLSEALKNHQKAQAEQDAKPVAVVPYSPIQAYAEQLPSWSKKPRGKRRWSQVIKGFVYTKKGASWLLFHINRNAVAVYIAL